MFRLTTTINTITAAVTVKSRSPDLQEPFFLHQFDNDDVSSS